MIISSRRGFIGGVAAVLAMPAIVKADSLMRLRGISMPILHRRWVLFYSGYTDTTMVRLDVSKRALPWPQYARAPEQRIIDFSERVHADYIKKA
jgi:hypothetical protein